MDHSLLKRWCGLAQARLGLGSRASQAMALPLGMLVGLLLSSMPAHAADGCKVLLCMAGNWRNIAACEPEVRQAMRDAARGRGWPRCSMASGGGGGSNTSSNTGSNPSANPNNAPESTVVPSAATHDSENQWAWAPGNCPPQYTFEVDAGVANLAYVCRYLGVINVWVNGQLWSRTWWDAAGDTATDYSAQARAQLGQTIDPKFDNDRNAWEAAQKAIVPEATSQSSQVSLPVMAQAGAQPPVVMVSSNAHSNVQSNARSDVQ